MCTNTGGQHGRTEASTRHKLSRRAKSVPGPQSTRLA